MGLAEHRAGAFGARPVQPVVDRGVRGQRRGEAGEGGEQADFEFAPVYTMDAELVEEAWTPF